MIQAVVFDWGDTVMRNFPAYSGAMAHWPVVEVVPGVEETLCTLHPTYRLALATNARDSGTELVRAALRRVGLEGYFDAVLTAHDLGAAKPDRRFFEALLARLGSPADEIVMVGDDYEIDVVGAKEAGLKAIWFNEAGAACPGAHPLHDAEIVAMVDLPAILENLTLPDVAQCLALLAEHDVPERTLQHSQTVAAVAFRLAAWLRRRGEPVDPLVAHRGGLLHDVAKVAARRMGASHSELGAQILARKGYDALAAITRRHMVLSILEAEVAPRTWEEKLVYYADKMAVGDEFQGVEARIEALCWRYPDMAERFRLCQPRILDLEAEICARLGTTAEEMVDVLRGVGQKGGPEPGSEPEDEGRP